jgi:hypothetical protein
MRLQTSSKYSDPEPSDDFISLSTDDEDDDDDEDVTSLSLRLPR